MKTFIVKDKDAGAPDYATGASDAVADVIGSVWAYYSLNLDKQKIIGLPIAVGGGRVKTAHGTIPVPAPAVLEILKDAKMVGGPVDSELATPTGCAVYAEICDEIREFISFSGFNSVLSDVPIILAGKNSFSLFKYCGKCETKYCCRYCG